MTTVQGFPFDAVRAAEAAAYVLDHVPERARTRFHVLKLLYLAEREALARYDRPICGGWYVSMPDGPVMSEVYECMKCAAGPDHQAPWHARVECSAAAKELQVASDRPRVRRLSRADVAILDEVVALHGQKTFGELWEFVHDAANVPEYQTPRGGRKSRTIAFQKLLASVGHAPASIREIEAEAAALTHHKSLSTK